MRWLALIAFVTALAVWQLAPRWAPSRPAPASMTIETPTPLPEIAIADGDGKAGALADFHGKVVLLNIWATWCVPCRKEMPTLDRLQVQLGGPDFEVVALSIDRGGAEVVRKFYGEIGVKRLGIHLDSAGAAFEKLGVVGLPTTLLIDRDGREVGRLVGPAEWDSSEMVAFLKSVITPRAGPLPAATEEEKHS
jgi:thiol-disulfide isomerase/thioredoxin